MSSRVEACPSPQIPHLPGTFPSPPPGELEAESQAVITTQLSLSQAVFERRAEFTRSYQTRVKVGTWNVASLAGTEKDIGAWFVDGKGVSKTLSTSSAGESSHGGNAKASNIESVGLQETRSSEKATTTPKNDFGSVPGRSDIGIYVLGLQEIVDIASAVEAFRPHSDPHPSAKWKQAIEEALPAGYKRVAEQQLIGLFLIIYASPSIAPTISSVSTTSVGTGLLGYMGNKGAVTARIVLGETTRMVFINCHLTAGVEKGCLDRRNWDSSQILHRTKFDPINNGGVMEEFGEGIGDEDFAFWFGDLNYRLDSMPGDDVRRLLMLHTQNEYENGQPSKSKIDAELSEKSLAMTDLIKEADRPSRVDLSSLNTVADSSLESISPPRTVPDLNQIDPTPDPTSLQTTLSSLLSHDQLHLQMQTGKAFHDGWREGPINFLPTYKYDVGSVGAFDSSEKRRGPSWCDRILYRTRKDRIEYLKKAQEKNEAKRRDEEMKARGIDQLAAEDEAVLFDYDPETDGAPDAYVYEVDNNSINSDIVTTKSGFEDKLELECYESHQRVLSSDHKPLDAVFTLTYDAIDPELKAKVHQDVARELDKAENEGRPTVTVVIDGHNDNDYSTNGESSNPRFEGIDFGHVRYHKQKSQTLTIANTGRVPATVGFVDRSSEQGHLGGVAPSWMNISFDRPSDNDNSNPNALREYTLKPGDTLNVELTLLVTDISQIRRLNEGLESLDDVLVLRVHDGRDYFLPFRATWLQSTFSRSVDKLIRIPEGGVRRLQHQRPDGNQGNGGDGVKWSAPRELFRLTEKLEELVERSIAEWGMTGEQGSPPWEVIGWPFAGWLGKQKEKELLKEGIREGLDTNQDFTAFFPPGTESLQKLEAVAESLLTFLKSLEDGIITTELWAELEQGMLEREKSKKTFTDQEERVWILEVLSSRSAHSISFTFITFMLSRVANEIAPTRPLAASPRSSLEITEGSEPRPHIQDEARRRRRRREVDGAFAAILADAMIRVPKTLKEKERKASKARMKAVVEVFLKSQDE